MTEQDRRYRVRVREQRHEPLTSVGCCDYLSPIHSAQGAGELLRVVLGHRADPGTSSWQIPVAGGIRTVELMEVTDEPVA